MFKKWALIAASCALGACGSGGGDDREYDCSVFPPAESSPYALPWTVGHSYRVLIHAAREVSQNTYAIDSQMPPGTEVLAMRSGIVARFEESYIDGDNIPGHENYVWIEHDDGTVGRYAHLTNMGVAVAVDQRIQQGDLIGTSGNTGNSTGPHLHFDVVDECDVRSSATYFELALSCETIPINFRNAGPSGTDLSCGLRNERTYVALPH